jgi:hypothetical protein
VSGGEKPSHAIADGDGNVVGRFTAQEVCVPAGGFDTIPIKVWSFYHFPVLSCFDCVNAVVCSAL